jgi:hypothetical protein
MDKHLNMALLQTALNAVEVGLGKMIAIIRGWDLSFCCFGLAALDIYAIKARGIWLVLLCRHFCEWTSRKSEAER